MNWHVHILLLLWWQLSCVHLRGQGTAQFNSVLVIVNCMNIFFICLLSRIVSIYRIVCVFVQSFGSSGFMIVLKKKKHKEWGKWRKTHWNIYSIENYHQWYRLKYSVFFFILITNEKWMIIKFFLIELQSSYCSSIHILIHHSFIGESTKQKFQWMKEICSISV